MTNIVVIMTDQQRADVCAREGFGLDTTPFLDSFARQGTWFDRAYTTYPMCVPARTSFLTGRFPSWTGVRTNDTDIDPRYDRDLFDVMNEQEYSTSLCGKNHSYLDPERADHWYQCSHLGGGARTDTDQEWDEWIEDNVGFGHSLEPCPVPAESTPVGRVISESIDWIRSVGDTPFFQWLSIPEPHPPYQVPEPYFSMFSREDVPPVEAGREALETKGDKYELVRRFAEQFADNEVSYDDVLPAVRALYYGMLRMIDDHVKRFVEFLEEQDLHKDTLLVFVSDHGDYVGQYGMMRKTAGVPESLVRIPMFFVGPGIEVSGDPHPAHVSLADVMPTLCNAVRASIPRGVQGRSLWPLLTGAEYPVDEFSSVYTEVGYGGRHVEQDKSVEDPQFCALSGTIRGLRKDDWKFTFDMQGEGQLYNLEADPVEVADRYDDPGTAERRCELQEDMLTWQLRLDALDFPHEIDRHIDPHNYWETDG